MIVTKYSIVGNSTVDLPIVGVSPSDRFILKNIDGLGPSEFSGVRIGRDSNLTDYTPEYGYIAVKDRKILKPKNKQLVILMALNPNHSIGETVADLREILYSLAAQSIAQANQSVLFKIWNGASVTAQIEGWISKLEVIPFTKDPLAQITIECFSPYFEAPADISVDLTSMSHSILTVDNIGSAETGFYLEVKITNTAGSYFNIYRIVHYVNSVPESRGISTSYGFAVNDHLIYDTREGTREILKRVGSTDTNILSYSLGGAWVSIAPGVNEIHLNTAYTFDYVKFIYRPRYLGV